jgi:hypothetical protein
MAKYLQDIYIHGPQKSFNLTKMEEEKFYGENRYLWSSIRLIEDLFSHPSKSHFFHF